MATCDVTSQAFCEVCDDEEDSVLAVAICHPCREFYCSGCVRIHKKFRATKDHKLIFLIASHKEEYDTWRCEICDDSSAVNVCKICKQLYCQKCSVVHSKFAATKSHELLQIASTNNSSNDKGEEKLASDFEEVLQIESRSPECQAQVPVPESKVKQSEEASTPGNVVKNPPYSGKTNAKVWEEASQFSIKLDSDEKSGYLSGIVTLPDGTIVIIDHTNGCLKVFDSNFRFLYKVGNIGNSFGIVSMKGFEVAVLNNKKVEFYTLGNEQFQKHDKYFTVKAFARGIAIHRHTRAMAVVYSWQIHGVQVFDESGKTVRDNVITEVNNEVVNIGACIEFDKHGQNYFLKVTRPGHDNWIVFYSLHGQYLWHTCIRGGIMAISFIDDHLLVFCGHRHVVRVSVDGQDVKKIAETNKHASRLHYDAKSRRILYCNSSSYDVIRVINYPQ